MSGILYTRTDCTLYMVQVYTLPSRKIKKEILVNGKPSDRFPSQIVPIILNHPAPPVSQTYVGNA